MNSAFKFEEMELKGAYIIDIFNSEDERGCLSKDFNYNTFKSNGVEFVPKETFYSTSKKGVIRGLHFQRKVQQAKLVRCIKGKIFDVIVDLRKESPTYGKWGGSTYLRAIISQYMSQNALGTGFLH